MTGELAAAADRVQSAIAEVRAAQASGDFERYGRALKALDDAMKAFEQAQGQATPTSGTPGGTPAPSGSASPSAPPPSPGGSPPAGGG